MLWSEISREPDNKKSLALSTIFCYLILDFYVKTRTRFFLRDKRLFEITEFEITRVDCTVGKDITWPDHLYHKPTYLDRDIGQHCIPR